MSHCRDFFSSSFFLRPLVWCSQLKYSISSKHGILKDQIIFLFLFENWRFFHAPINSSLFSFRFCVSSASTYTYRACLPLAQARHTRSCHCRSFPSKQFGLWGTFSPRCRHGSVSVPDVQRSLLFQF